MQNADLALSVVLRAPAIKCPWLAIPRPGIAPFVVSREIVARCIKDATVTHCEINGQLTIEVVREHGRGKYKLVNLAELSGNYNMGGFRAIREKIHDWARSQRNKGTLSAMERKRAGKYTVKIRDTKGAIAKLQSRLDGSCYRYNDRICKPQPPRNPVLEERSEYDIPNAEIRAHVLRWYAGKPQRKAIHRIKAAHRQDKSLVGLYKALEAAGFTLKRYTEVKHVRRGYVTPESHVYLSHIAGGGYKPAALRWLKEQVHPKGALIAVWSIDEFQKKVNDGFLG